MGPAERAAVDAMAASGLRVLGVAEARWHGPDFPATQRGFKAAVFAIGGVLLRSQRVSPAPEELRAIAFGTLVAAILVLVLLEALKRRWRIGWAA